MIEEKGVIVIKASEIFPDGSGFMRTVQGRRMRLCNHIAEILADHGRQKVGWNKFTKHCSQTQACESASTHSTLKELNNEHKNTHALTATLQLVSRTEMNATSSLALFVAVSGSHANVQATIRRSQSGQAIGPEVLSHRKSCGRLRRIWSPVNGG
jgi:hypothetical protein